MQMEGGEYMKKPPLKKPRV